MPDPMVLTVHPVNLAEVQGDLEAIERRARDWRLPFRFFSRGTLEPFFRRQFETAGSHGGRPWAPLAPSTVRARLRQRGGNRGGASRPLWDSGELKASLDSGGGFALRSFERLRMAHGTRLPRGAFHQEGAGHVPVREIIPDPWPGFLQRDWEKVADRWLTRGFGEAPA